MHHLRFIDFGLPARTRMAIEPKRHFAIDAMAFVISRDCFRKVRSRSRRGGTCRGAAKRAQHISFRSSRRRDFDRRSRSIARDASGACRMLTDEWRRLRGDSRRILSQAHSSPNDSSVRPRTRCDKANRAHLPPVSRPLARPNGLGRHESQIVESAICVVVAKRVAPSSMRYLYDLRGQQTLRQVPVPVQRRSVSDRLLQRWRGHARHSSRRLHRLRRMQRRMPNRDDLSRWRARSREMA